MINGSEQVWFVGSHRDVGGGNPDASLADIPLLWIVERARDYGLAFKADAFATAGGWGVPGSNLPAVEPDRLGPMHESREFLYRLVPAYVRRLGETDPEHEFVSSSVITRLDKEPGYKPPGLCGYLTGARKAKVMDVPAQPRGVGRVPTGGE